jgi:hypothetical protein
VFSNAQRNKFHIVHDNEVVQVRHQLLELIGRNLQLQPGLPGKRRSGKRVGFARARIRNIPAERRKLFVFAPHRQVALNASLRVEHQVPRPGVRKQVVHSVGDHSAEPAEAVFAAHGYAPHPSQVVQGGSVNQSLYFCLRRVQHSWGKRTTVGNSFLRLAGGFIQRNHSRCLYGLSQACLGPCLAHGETFPPFGAVFPVTLGAGPHPDYSLGSGVPARAGTAPTLAMLAAEQSSKKAGSKTKREWIWRNQ